MSLLGFISMVWLKDQLGNGGAPNWLARDQQEVDELRQREMHNVVSVVVCLCLLCLGAYVAAT